MNKYLFVVLIVFCCYSCTSSKKGGTAISHIDTNNNVEVIDIDKGEKKERISFSEFLEEPQVTILETKDECLIKRINTLEFFDNKIYILDETINRLFVFDMDGHFLYRIGAAGGGPGEYVAISDFTIDRENNIIYVFDEATSRIHKYDALSQKYLSTIKIEQKGRQHFYIQFIGGHLYMNETAIEGSGDQYLLKQLDPETGKQIKAYLDADKYNKGWNLTLRTYHSFFYGKSTPSPKYIEMFMDTIIAIEKDKIIPAYAIKSKDFASHEDVQTLMEEYYKNDNTYDFSSIVSSKKIYNINNYVETPNIVYFRYEKEDDTHHLIYNKQNGDIQITKRLINDFIMESLPMNPDFCHYNEKGVFGIISTEIIPFIMDNVIIPGNLNPNIDQHKELMNISEESNPIILYYPFKL